MKHIGVREFRDHASDYLAGRDVLAVERHGQLIGFYVPTGHSRRAALRQALEGTQQAARAIMDRTGLSEDELSRLLDPTQPLP
jgi:hypothetical protein